MKQGTEARRGESYPGGGIVARASRLVRVVQIVERAYRYGIHAGVSYRIRGSCLLIEFVGEHGVSSVAHGVRWGLGGGLL